MNWQAVGAVSELLGSVAVFITLGYLAVQVRHARAEARRALSQGRMEANRELLKLDLEDRHLESRIKAEAVVDGGPPPIIAALMEKAQLSEKEAYRIFLVEAARWNYRIHVITHWHDLPKSEQLIFDQGTRVRMSAGLSRWLYDEHFERGATAEVRAYLDRTLS